MATGDAPCVRFTRGGAKQARMRREEQRSIGWIDAESVHVNRPGIFDARTLPLGRLLWAAAGEQ